MKNIMLIFWAYLWRWLLLGWGGSLSAALVIGVVLSIMGVPGNILYSLGYLLGFFGWFVASPIMFHYVLTKKNFKKFTIEIVPRTD